MAIVRNLFISILILLVAVLWFYLHPSEKKSAFETGNNKNPNARLIALVVSRSGAAQDIGKSVELGVRHYFSEIIAEPDQTPLGLMSFDDKSDPAEAKRIAEQIAADPRFIAVIGHTDNETTGAAAPIYAQAKIPMLSPTANSHLIGDDNEWAFSTMMADNEEGQFMAFFIEKALEGQKIVMVAHEENRNTEILRQFHDTVTEEGMQLIDITVNNHEGHMHENERDDVLKEILTTQPDVVFLSLHPDHMEDILVSLKDAGYKKRLVADGTIGTPAFAARFADLPKEQISPGFYTNDLVVPVPFVLDVANNLAHHENHLYHDREGHNMPWPYAYGYDSAKVLVQAIDRMRNAGHHGVNYLNDRLGIRETLESMNSADKGVSGITGTSFFNQKGNSEHPPLFATFRARSLTSAYNQFAVNDIPLEHYDTLAESEHIRINDRVFGLAEVVFTGIRFHSLKDINLEKHTVHAEFDIWFRFQHEFHPEDIVFDNAVENTVAMTIIDEHQVEKNRYKKIRVSGDFYFHRSAGDFIQHKIKILLSFQHRKVNRNEIIYVVDSTAYNTNKFNKPLIEQMQEDGSLPESEEMALDSAVMFEDITTVRAFGDPVFIDGKLPFSRFNTEVQLHEQGLSLIRQLSEKLDEHHRLAWFFVSIIMVLVSMYAVSSARILAFLIILRFIGLSGVLMGVELLLFSSNSNTSVMGLSLGGLDLLVRVFNALWVLLLALFINSMLKRHLWVGIEKSTGYPVPSIAKTLVGIVIFIIAAMFIYSMVFNKTLMSIVAASSALTVVLGFALRELIMDFFSGIILNIEQPFRIGNFVSFHVGRGEKVEGFIQEMNWRTVRVKDEFGNTIVLPNSKISIEHLNNMSLAQEVEWKFRVYVDPAEDPQQVSELLHQALQDNPYIIGYNDSDQAPDVRYKGVENIAGCWVGVYRVRFTLAHLGKRSKASEVVWKNIWQLFGKAGIKISPPVNSFRTLHNES